MDNFKSAKTAIFKYIEDADKDLESKAAAIARREALLEKQKEEMAKKFPINQKIIELNVGGAHFTTFKETLCKEEGSMLEAMFRYCIGSSTTDFAAVVVTLK